MIIYKRNIRLGGWSNVQMGTYKNQGITGKRKVDGLMTKAREGTGDAAQG